jgi:DNA-binding NarL/FixJ family response regulator
MSTAIPMTDQRKLRLLVVQSNAILRLGLRSALERNGAQVIGEATQRGEILEMVASKHPDVVLFDGAMTFHDAHRAYNAAQVVAQMRRIGTCGIIVLVATPDEEHLFQFLMAGAAAYESAYLTAEDLVEKVRRVSRGEYLINGELFCQDAEQEDQEAEATPSPEDAVEPSDDAILTERQIDVLRCVMHGYSNKEIGRELRISDQTVKNHLTAINWRLKVPDRTAAVVTALRLGLIELSDNLPDRRMTPKPRSQGVSLPKKDAVGHKQVHSTLVPIPPSQEEVAV